MARRKDKKERAFQLDGEAARFRPRKTRPHLAQEMRENMQNEVAESLIRNLTPWAQANALGVSQPRGEARGS